MPFSFGGATTAVFALLLVLGLVLVSARALRAAGLARAAPGAKGRLTLLDALALDRARRLVLVRCNGREVLLLTGGGVDVVVGWVPPGPEARG